MASEKKGNKKPYKAVEKAPAYKPKRGKLAPLMKEEDKEKAESYFNQKGIKDNLVSYVKLNDMLLVKQAEFQFK